MPPSRFRLEATVVDRAEELLERRSKDGQRICIAALVGRLPDSLRNLCFNSIPERRLWVRLNYLVNFRLLVEGFTSGTIVCVAQLNTKYFLTHLRIAQFGDLVKGL